MPSVDIGCGPLHKAADVGIDILPGPAVDIVHDLNQTPWPLDASTFDRILCLDVLEHLRDLMAVMQEIHRIATPGARVDIQVPTGSSRDLYTDPTHIRGFGYHSFDYFDPMKALFNDYRYSERTFRVKDVRFVNRPHGKMRTLDRFMCAFANRSPELYESRLAFFYPMTALRFELEVLK